MRKSDQKMDLSTLSYPLTKHGNIYTFTTEDGNLIEASFTKVWFKLNDILGFYDNNIEIYEYQFKRVKFQSKKFDRRTSLSILNAAIDFLDRYKIAFYTADSPTRKDRELFKLYDIWYRRYVNNDEIIKIDKTVNIDGNFIYFTCYLKDIFILPTDQISCLFDSILSELYPNGIISEY